MTRIRALFLAPTLTVGGAERQWASLVPLLERRGFAITVATLSHEGHFFAVLGAAGIDVRAIGMRSRFDLRGVLRALALRSLRPDIVVTQSIDAHTLGHAVAASSDAPHVAVEHVGPGFPRRSHHDLLYRAVAPRTDAVVAVSPAQIPVLHERHYRRDRIRVIPNGIDVPPNGRPRAAVRAELGIASDEFLALLVATLRPEKRPDVFVTAVAAAHRRSGRIRGLVVGDGPQLERTRALAGPDGPTQVVGYREAIGELVAAADAVCLSSDVEAAPMSLLEAMALGQPVIATDVGGVGNTVSRDESALLVPPNNVEAFAAALVDLASDPARAAALGQSGQRIYRERFTDGKMADAYADLLSSIARRRMT